MLILVKIYSRFSRTQDVRLPMTDAELTDPNFVAAIEASNRYAIRDRHLVDIYRIWVDWHELCELDTLPEDLTDSQRRSALATVRAGLTRGETTRLVGVKRRTLRRWLAETDTDALSGAIGETSKESGDVKRGEGTGPMGAATVRPLPLSRGARQGGRLGEIVTTAVEVGLIAAAGIGTILATRGGVSWLIRALTGGTPKVIGISIAMVPSGPIPGSTPISVPTETPSRQ